MDSPDNSRTAVSISEAARRGYASRVTIQKAVKSGRVSLHSADAKVKSIQISELDRVFGARGQVDGVGIAVSSKTMQDIGRQSSSENKPLPTQVDLLTQERDQLKAELARERDNAEWLKGQVEATQRQLTDERGRSWWQRMFGDSR